MKDTKEESKNKKRSGQQLQSFTATGMINVLLEEFVAQQFGDGLMSVAELEKTAQQRACRGNHRKQEGERKVREKGKRERGGQTRQDKSKKQSRKGKKDQEREKGNTMKETHRVRGNKQNKSGRRGRKEGDQDSKREREREGRESDNILYHTGVLTELQ